jgi:hypothetical protein
VDAGFERRITTEDERYCRSAAVERCERANARSSHVEEVDGDAPMQPAWPHTTVTPDGGEMPRSSAAARASVDDIGSETPGEDSRATSRPLSRGELRKLEARARARLHDPDYRRRVEATDGLARKLVENRDR